MSEIKFLVSPGKRLLLLALTTLVGFLAIAVLSAFLLPGAQGAKAVAMMRIVTVLQDIFVFIVPALVTALIATRQPVRLLALQHMPSPMSCLLAIATLLVASPAMDVVIRLNASVHLPESMQHIEQALRAMEDSAEDTVGLMLGQHTPLNLVVNVLIVGVLAGFSEELFFRGALQRLLGTGVMGRHAAIFTAAIIFSALHMQFFGFVPRMLLGIYFGYLLVWSGSIWLPMIVHAFNNSMFVVMQYATGSGELTDTTGTSPWLALGSAALTAAGLWLMWRRSSHKCTDAF